MVRLFYEKLSLGGTAIEKGMINMKKIRLFTSLILVTILILSITIALPVTVGAETEAREPYGLNYLKIIERVVSNDGQWEYLHFKDNYYKDVLHYDEGKDVYGLGNYLGTEKDITLPTEIDGHSLTVLGVNAGKAESITIPKSYIYFWFGCYGDKLKTIIFSREYEENEIIDVCTFGLKNSPSLKKVVMPNLWPVAKILHGDWHQGSILSCGSGNQGFFEGDTNLTEIVFPDNMTDIGTCCFKNCTSLRNLVLPEGIQRVNGSALEGCKLDTLILPDSIIYCPLGGAKVIVVNNKENNMYKTYPNHTFVFMNPTTVIYGDINGDEEYNINDVTILQQYLAEQVVFDIADKGDYNKDGKTTSKDALCMQLALADRYTPPLESDS